MSFFLVSWIAWTCPGGWFSGFVPVAARPIACTPKVQHESYERLPKARARVVELGPTSNPSITLIQGLRLTDRPVVWVTSAKF